MCGEKKETTQDILGNTGSPSRVRGKGTAPRPCSAARGITPACAGKSFFMALRHRTGRDHPRVCGEKSATAQIFMIVGGSPPRVRGKGIFDCVGRAAFGITPACAGKSRRRNYRSIPSGDHPRVCGEKQSTAAATPSSTGSPPRVRGKAQRRMRPFPIGRITPACAGKRLKKALKNKDF